MGMLCSSWLPSRYNLCRLFIPLFVDGMVPLKLLSLSKGKFKFLKESIPFGIGPFMFHDSGRNSWRELERFPTESGRMLEKGCSPIINLYRDLHLVKSVRKLSSRLFG